MNVAYTLVTMGHTEFIAGLLRYAHGHQIIFHSLRVVALSPMHVGNIIEGRGDAEPVADFLPNLQRGKMLI